MKALTAREQVSLESRFAFVETARSVHEPRELPALREARPPRAWPAWIIAVLFSACYIIATTDLKARENWNSFDTKLVDSLTERLEGGQASRQIGFLLLGAIGIALCIKPTLRKFRPDYRLLFPLLVFLSWVVISPLWSTERELTVKRLVLLACVASAIVGFWRHYRPHDLALLALIGSATICAGGIAYELLAGSVGGEHGVYRFCGTMHPNHQGINAVLLMLSSLAFFDRTRLKRFLLLAAFAGVILLLTKSRTALLAGLAAAALFATLRLPRRMTLIGAVAVTAIAAMAFVLSKAGAAEGIGEFLEMGRTDSDATTLTGRTDIWNTAFSLLNADPVRWMTGFAYQSFWTPERTRYISDQVYFHISEGHSAYFDTLLETGLVGLLLYVTLLFGSLAKWTWLTHRRAGKGLAFLAAILAFAAVHSITESSTIAPNFPTFFSFSAIAAAALFRAPQRSPDRTLLEDLS